MMTATEMGPSAERAALLSAIRAATETIVQDTPATRFSKAMNRLGGLLAKRALARRYNPDWASQPRVPRGEPGGGQWVDVAGTVINVCIPVGIFRDVDAYGNKSYIATYECRDGRTFTIEGHGTPNGIVRDPNG